MRDVILTVTVALPDDARELDAFEFVVKALEEHCEKHEDLAPEAIRIEGAGQPAVEV